MSHTIANIHADIPALPIPLNTHPTKITVTLVESIAIIIYPIIIIADPQLKTFLFPNFLTNTEIPNIQAICVTVNAIDNLDTSEESPNISLA